MKKSVIADLILLFIAFIWGTTFVIVQQAIETLPPHSFNGIRFALASIALFPFILLKNGKSLTAFKRNGWIAGIILGFFLFGGYSFQTVGLLYTTASKSAFITGLSVVLVPTFSVAILKIVPKWNAIIGVVLAAVGLYLLTMVDVNGLQLGDMLTFLCAVFFALQITFTGKYASEYPALPLAWIQITTVAFTSFIFAFFTEDTTLLLNGDYLFQSDVIIALLITSILATAFAYLAQTSFQKYTTSTRVAIIFATEPVFAALTSFVVLGERLSIPAFLGGSLIFIGMILAEIPQERIGSLLTLSRKNKPKIRESERL